MKSFLTLDLIKKLRDITGVSIAEIKKALEDANQDVQKAKELLRARGSTKAEKRSTRETKVGMITSYVHSNNKVGVLVELLSETDFVARSDKFKELAHEIALQIASMNPEFLSLEEMPKEIVDHEKSIYREELIKSGKPTQVIDQIVEGRFQKHCEEICLLDQKYVKDQNLTIKELLNQFISQIGENIKIGRFVRFEV